MLLTNEIGGFFKVDEVDFLYTDKHNIFYKLILPFLVGVVMHVQITNQTAEFFEMQYHKKSVIDCFNFLDLKRPLPRILKNFPVLGECA